MELGPQNQNRVCWDLYFHNGSIYGPFGILLKQHPKTTAVLIYSVLTAQTPLINAFRAPMLFGRNPGICKKLRRELTCADGRVEPSIIAEPSESPVYLSIYLSFDPSIDRPAYL